MKGKMKIPKKIKIGGHIIEVGKHTDLENDMDGFYDKSLDRISIKHTFPQSKLEEIFLHEAIEAIKYKYDLELKHKDLIVLSEALYQVLVDNKLKFGD